MLMNGKEANNLIISGHRFRRDDLAGKKVKLLNGCVRGSYLTFDNNGHPDVVKPSGGGLMLEAGSTWTVIVAYSDYIYIKSAWIKPADYQVLN